MVDHPRLPLRPRRLAVHAGTGGAAGGADQGILGVVPAKARTHSLRPIRLSGGATNALTLSRHIDIGGYGSPPSRGRQVANGISNSPIIATPASSAHASLALVARAARSISGPTADTSAGS